MQVILLSRLSGRCDELEAQIERMDAKVEAMATKMDEVLAMVGQMINGRALPAKDAKPIKPFADYIKDKKRANEVLAMLHGWIDRAERVKALVYLKAAMEAKILVQPPYPVAAVVFPGRLGSKSLYYAYLSEPNAFGEDDLEELQRAMEVLHEIVGQVQR